MSASGACVVIPGASIANGQTYADSDMRAIAKPTVYVGAGQIGETQMDPALLSTLGGGGGGNTNYFLNPNFGDPFWRGAGPLACPAGVGTTLAEHWAITASGGAATQQQSGTVPNVDSLFSLQLVGATGVTGVTCSQNLPRDVSAFLQQKFTVSFFVYNGTGAALVPQVVCATATTVNNFSAVSAQATIAGASCAAGAWTRASVTFDGSTWTGMGNGLQVAISLPSGALAANTQLVNLAQIKLELGTTATGFEPPYDQPLNPPNPNLFINGTMDEGQWAGTSVSCGAGTDTYPVLNWFCQPSGAAVAVSRSTTVPDASFISSAEITGASSVTTVDFGQNFMREASGQMQGDLTFSGWIYNGTGASLSPTLALYVPSGTANDFSSLTAISATSLGALPSGAWTFVTLGFSGGVAGSTGGLRVAVEFPTGSLSSGGQSVLLTGLKLEPGDAPTALLIEPPRSIPVAVMGSVSGFSLQNAVGELLLTMTCTEAMLKTSGTGGGFPLLVTGVSVTLNGVNNGANGLDTGSLAASTWYAIHIIAKPNGATAGLISASATAPALPAGYTHFAFVAAAQTTATLGPPLNFWPLKQINRKAWTLPTSCGVLSVTGANTFQSQSLANGVPPWATVAIGNYGCHATGRAILAGDSSGTGAQMFNLYTTGANVTDPNSGNTAQSAAPFRVPMFAAQTIYIQSPDTGATHILDVTGYEF